jgi:3-oxoacyl-[acyl-carrier protein] reductase
VIAAAHELAGLGVTANVINPGAIDTGWMDDGTRVAVRRDSLQDRLGTPSDTAELVSFLVSERGRWINAQLLHSDGGRATR